MPTMVEIREDETKSKILSSVDDPKISRSKKGFVVKGKCDEDEEKYVRPPAAGDPIPEGVCCIVNDAMMFDMVSESIESFAKGTPLAVMPSAAGVTPFEIFQASQKRKVNAFLDEMEKDGIEKMFLSLTATLITIGLLRMTV